MCDCLLRLLCRSVMLYWKVLCQSALSMPFSLPACSVRFSSATTSRPNTNRASSSMILFHYLTMHSWRWAGTISGCIMCGSVNLSIRLYVYGSLCHSEWSYLLQLRTKLCHNDPSVAPLRFGSWKVKGHGQGFENADIVFWATNGPVYLERNVELSRLLISSYLI